MYREFSNRQFSYEYSDIKEPFFLYSAFVTKTVFLLKVLWPEKYIESPLLNEKTVISNLDPCFERMSNFLSRFRSHTK